VRLLANLAVTAFIVFIAGYGAHLIEEASRINTMLTVTADPDSSRNRSGIASDSTEQVSGADTSENVQAPETLLDFVEDSHRSGDPRAVHAALLKLRPSMPHSTATRMVQALTHQSRLYGYDPILALAIAKVESDVGQRTLSKKGARGMMQILPATGKEAAEGLGIKWQGQNTLDSIEKNISLGMWYLHSLEERFSNIQLAIIAYNRGPKRLEGEMAQGRTNLGYLQRVMDAYLSLSDANAAKADPGQASD